MAITNARMQQKRGEEFNFDPDKMLPGEWAVSLDTKYVRMCFSPGVCVRMATYEAFEADMAQIQKILEECQTIEDAVKLINSQVSEKLQATIEYTNQAKQYRNEAEESATNAYASANNAKSSEDKAKVSETNAKASETNAKISEENAQRVAESLPEDYTDLSKAFYNTAIKQKAVGDNIHVTDSAEARNVEFGLYGKAEQNGEPTPDNPIEIVVSGSDGSVEVVSCGKNLVSGEYINMYANMNVVQKFEISSSVQASLIRVKPNTTYLLGRKGGSQYSTVGFSEKEPVLGESYLSAIHVGSRETMSVTTPSNVNYMLWYHHFLNNPATEIFCYETTETSAEYEPYTETTSTIPTPNGLCGIKVSSGGNYTDENGQQWICDEIVKYADGSGQDIQRIGKTVLNSDTNFSKFTLLGNTVRVQIAIPNIQGTTLCMCNRFQYLNNYSSDTEHYYLYNGTLWIFVNVSRLSEVSEAGIKEYFLENETLIYYKLAEPIITDLSAEEIAEIEKLHTFYPITNISNDADCGMSVTYLCDAKNYIDNRLALIETALVNSI